MSYQIVHCYNSELVLAVHVSRSVPCVRGSYPALIVGSSLYERVDVSFASQASN